ncbi:hypothetical protein HOO65_100014 [Ceratocystis lukuohia]|uniref:CCHC-type domain-containing protein n=1 Tax=Ceratocystis lukuohia TaxID=2019550 RepID=A0ABR4M8K5_9PEZI
MHYLLDENPMEGVERSNGGSGRNQKKDEELATRILRLSPSESFQVIGSQGTVREAYKVLETICAPDAVDAEFEDMGKYLRTTLRKDLNMLQNWYYYKAKFALYYTKEEINEKSMFKFFLIGLPKEYRDVAKQCHRDGLTAEKALKLLQPVSALKKTEEKTNPRGKSGLKCFNCNKKGHKAVDCWAKKKNDSQQKAKMAVKENQCVLKNAKETQATVRLADRSRIGASKIGLSKIKEEVYIKLLANVKCPNGMVAKLDRCLYGLKQAAYQWTEDCTKFLRSIGFENMVTEPCLLYHAEWKMVVLLLMKKEANSVTDFRSWRFMLTEGIYLDLF